MSAQLSLYFCVFIVEVYISTTNTATAQSKTSLSHMPQTTMNSNPLTYTASSADSWSCNFEGLDQFVVWGFKAMESTSKPEPEVTVLVQVRCQIIQDQVSSLL